MVERLFDLEEPLQPLGREPVNERLQGAQILDGWFHIVGVERD